MPLQSSDKNAAQEKRMHLINAALAQIEQIATHRSIFSKRYRDYAAICTPEEYDAFRKSFLPKIKIA